MMSRHFFLVIFLAAVGYLPLGKVTICADEPPTLLQAWKDRSFQNRVGAQTWVVTQQDRSSNFGLRPTDVEIEDTAASRIHLQWNGEGFQLQANCSPPSDLSEPRQIRERDFLGTAQIHHQYMDSMVVRFAKGQLNSVSQPYSLLVQPDREIHSWERVQDAFPRGAISTTWQADSCFCVPTLAWLPDAVRVALGVTNQASGPLPELVRSEFAAFVAGRKCDVWVSSGSGEIRTYWTDPLRQQLILKCMIGNSSRSQRLRYEFEYEPVGTSWNLSQITLLQFTGSGGIHDKLVLRAAPVVQESPDIVEHRPEFPAGALVSDFPRKVQFFVRKNDQERITAVRDTVLHRSYVEIAAGCSPGSIAKTWLRGFSPTRNELWEACQTWESFVIASIVGVLFCLIPRRRRIPNTDHLPFSEDGTALNPAQQTVSVENQRDGL